MSGLSFMYKSYILRTAGLAEDLAGGLSSADYFMELSSRRWWRPLLHDLRYDCGANSSSALAYGEALAFLDCQGVEEFASEFDVVARHDHLALFVFGTFGPEEAAGFIYIAHQD